VWEGTLLVEWTDILSLDLEDVRNELWTDWQPETGLLTIGFGTDSDEDNAPSKSPDRVLGQARLSISGTSEDWQVAIEDPDTGESVASISGSFPGMPLDEILVVLTGRSNTGVGWFYVSDGADFEPVIVPWARDSSEEGIHYVVANDMILAFVADHAIPGESINIWRSADARNWEDIGPAPWSGDTYEVTSLSERDGNAVAVIRDYEATGVRMFESADGGDTWTDLGAEQIPDELVPAPIHNIFGILEMDRSSFSYLLSQIEAPQQPGPFWDTFVNLKEPYTLFAPTDEAFDKLPVATKALFNSDPNAIVDVLTYHLVDGALTLEDLSTPTNLTTLQGSDITITVVDGIVRLNDTVLVTTRVPATNGVIYIIDTVLSPRDELCKSRGEACLARLWNLALVAQGIEHRFPKPFLGVSPTGEIRPKGTFYGLFDLSPSLIISHVFTPVAAQVRPKNGPEFCNRGQRQRASIVGPVDIDEWRFDGASPIGCA
jgi:hypothetical protein